MNVFIELTAAVDIIGTTKTFYLSKDGFTSSSGDTPANQYFDATVLDPGVIGVNAFGDGRTYGATQLQTGAVVLNNVDGAYDAWKNYSFDGRPAVIRIGDGSSGYPSATTPIFKGTVESVDVSWSEVTINIKDQQFVFTLPLQAKSYGGTNALPNGIDGTTDIAGMPKPRTYGKVLNVSGPCVNTSLLIYQVNDGPVQDIPAVYDRGLALSKGADYATNALLQAATGLAAGSYVTCLAEGFFRLASSPTGQITQDVLQGAAAANRTAAQILKQIAIAAGVLPANISSIDTAAMDVANSAVLGIFVDDQTTFLDAMDQIANSVGAYYGFDVSGTMRMGILQFAAGSATIMLTDALPGSERRAVSNAPQPMWAILINYAKNYNVQGSDIAGAVTEAQRSFLINDFRTVRTESASTKLQFLLADTVEFDTLIVASADAVAEANRRLALYRGKRDIFDVIVPLDAIVGTSLSMLSVVSFTFPRFDLAAGRLFRLIGFQLELKQNQVVLSLWG